MDNEKLSEIFNKNYEKHTLKKFIIKQLLKAINEEHWITIGADKETEKKGTHILVRDGETHKQATERKIAEWKAQKGGSSDKKSNKDNDSNNKKGKKENSNKLKIKHKELSNFKPATNIEDALNVTRLYSDGIGQSFSNLPLENINEINNALDYVYNNVCKFNKLKSVIKSKVKALAAADARGLEIGNMADYTPEKCKEEFDKQVTNWQPDYQKKIDSLSKLENPTSDDLVKLSVYKELIKYKRMGVYSSPENFIKETTIHELGHTISFQVIEKEANENDVNIRNTISYKLINGTLKKARSNGDIYKISQYANKDSYEFYAECFLMYNIGEKMPSYIEDMVKEIIKMK